MFVDRFMPCLKFIVQNAINKELRLLRGKTIECISLIGLAVSREKVSTALCVYSFTVDFGVQMCTGGHNLDGNCSVTKQ